MSQPNLRESVSKLGAFFKEAIGFASDIKTLSGSSDNWLNLLTIGGMTATASVSPLIAVPLLLAAVGINVSKKWKEAKTKTDIEAQLRELLQRADAEERWHMCLPLAASKIRAIENGDIDINEIDTSKLGAAQLGFELYRLHKQDQLQTNAMWQLVEQAIRQLPTKEDTDKIQSLAEAMQTSLDRGFQKHQKQIEELANDILPLHENIKRIHPKLDQLLKEQQEHKEISQRNNQMLQQLTGSDGLPVQPIPLDDYAKAMRERYQHLRLDLLDPASFEQKRICLTDVFVEPNVQDCAGYHPKAHELPQELKWQLKEEGKLPEGVFNEDDRAFLCKIHRDAIPQPAFSLLNAPDHQRIIFIGDPGCGKSTMVQYHVLNWLTHQRDQPLPLLIELREFARNWQTYNTRDLIAYLCAGQGLTFRFQKRDLEHYVASQPTVLLLDGLDEVFDPELRKDISAAIIAFAQTYPLMRLVMTSRVVGYDQTLWNNAGYRTYAVLGFTREQIGLFTQRWYLQAETNERERKEKISLLLKAVDNSPSILLLAENPLLLTMLALLNNRKELPDDRLELYERCSTLQLDIWKTTDAFVTDDKLKQARLNLNEKQRLLQGVARAMQEGQGMQKLNLMSRQSLEDALAQHFPTREGIDKALAARGLVNLFRERNYIICNLGQERYAFVHRSFLEYFCARELHHRYYFGDMEQREDWLMQCYQQHMADDAWQEVLLLLSASLQQRDMAFVLSQLLHKAMQYPMPSSHDRVKNNNAPRYRWLNTIAQCYQAIRNPDVSVLPKAKLAEALINTIELFNNRNYPYFLWQKLFNHWILLTPDASITLKHWIFKKSDNDILARMSVVKLAERFTQDAEAPALLKQLAQDTQQPNNLRTMAIESLAKHFKQDAEVPVLLIQLAQDTKQLDYVRNQAISSLAAHFTQNAEVPVLLIQLAQDTKQPDVVRNQAMTSLAEHFKQDAKVPALLKQLAQDTQQSNNLRTMAIESLAKHFKQDAELPALLKQLAQDTQQTFGVCYQAMRSLAKHFKQDAEVPALLKQIAQDTQQPSDVRIQAIKSLVEHFKQDAELPALLKQLAQDTQQPSFVRNQAMRSLVEHFKQDAQVPSLLKQLAQDTQQPSFVRTQAMRSLVEHI